MATGGSRKHAGSAPVLPARTHRESPAWSCVSKHTTLVTRETKAKWAWMLFLGPSRIADEVLPEQLRGERQEDEGFL